MKWNQVILFLLFVIVSCTQVRPVKNCITYNEAADPKLVDNKEWLHIPAKLNASFGSIDKRYEKSDIPLSGNNISWKGSGWQGERVSAQVVLWSPVAIEQVECVFSPFRSPGNTLDPSIARARFVRYVLTDIFEPGCGYRKPEDFPVSLVADGLDTISCINMEAKTTRPVWLSFDIPIGTKPGIYSSTLHIYAKGQKTHKLNIALEVLPQTLPKPSEWEFHLDLWQHPSAVARVQKVKPWSEEHWNLLIAPMKLLADAGQKVITANLNKDPWNNQCYDRYEDMIVWTKNADGTWKYDYTVFDRWVEMMLQLGINRFINCYSMAPWNNELHYYDAQQKKYIDISAAPGSKEFINLWTPFLKDFSKHLKEKGWLGITNIAMDERSPEDMKAILGLLGQAAPELGISLADNHKSYKQYTNIRDLCIAFGSAFDASDLEYRKKNRLISTYYVCCSDKFPNVFTFSDPAEAAYIPWHAMGAGFDGFLRWAYNSWTENPFVDSRFRTWPAGDTYIIYPGGISSIRFERLREGIQDAEKIRILRNQFLLSSTADAPKKLEKLENELEKFKSTDIPSIPASDMIHEARKVLDDLSR